jgi:hypothetical protein
MQVLTTSPDRFYAFVKKAVMSHQRAFLALLPRPDDEPAPYRTEASCAARATAFPDFAETIR